MWSYPQTWIAGASRHDNESAADRLLRHYRRLLRIIRMAGRVVCHWAERTGQRRTLAELDDRQVRDIGLTRRDIWHECGKPFWRR